MNNKILVLAFDIERAGATLDYDTIGIGISVVNNEMEELDSLLLTAYIPEQTKFEERSWNEFWIKYPDRLKDLIYAGEKTREERQAEIITLFQEFRSKWQTYAKENGYAFELVSQNNVYDGGFINLLIQTHTTNLPIPYTAPVNSSAIQEFSAYWEVKSEQRGLLFAIDPSYAKKFGYSKRISELYDLPKPFKIHDHNPANDAYSIAYDQQVLLGIRDGRFTRKIE